MAKEKFLPTILVDTREKTPWRFNKCSTCAGSIKQKLDTGDYTMQGMEDIFIIERKGEVSELYNNLSSGYTRFEKELERMQSFKYKFLILEFDVEDIYDFPDVLRFKYKRKSRLTSKFVFSRLAEISAKYGVQIMFLGSMKDKKKREKAKAFLRQFMYKYYNLYMTGEI